MKLTRVFNLNFLHIVLELLTFGTQKSVRLRKNHMIVVFEALLLNGKSLLEELVFALQFKQRDTVFMLRKSGFQWVKVLTLNIC